METVLLIKRKGIDKTWHVAPYDVKHDEIDKWVKWLRLSLPAFEYKLATLEVSGEMDDLTNPDE